MSQCILLVEGSDDSHTMWHLLNAQGIDITVAKPDSNGADGNGGDRKLLDSIPARLRTTGLECLAVVIDANEKGPKARWDAIRSRLVSAGYEEIPPTHSPDGMIVDLPDGIRFGAWIMPDNRSTGMLEDFVAQMIRKEDKVLPLVDRFLESIPEEDRRFSQGHRPKARIHSWLAVQEEPGKPMGQAITKGYLDATQEVVQPFLKWIGDLLKTDGE